jgi:superfamily I DNA and RNA helicase
MPLRIFCFQDEFGDRLGEWVQARLGDLSDAVGKEMPLGSDGIDALEKLLASPFQLKAPLGSSFSQDGEELQLLTQQQFHLLSHIGDIKRVAVSGAAGTGKTVLAIEEARRCAEAGKRTLFTCFSPALALHVQYRMQGIANLTAADFHDVCSRLAKQAGVPVPGGSSERVYDELYPEVLMQAFDLLPDQRFDAVIVDEGQDFLPLWWSAVDAGLAPGVGSRLRIFFDSNQRVYKSIGRLPEDVQLAPIRLTQNLRNTQRIHEHVMPQYEGFAITATGPEGMAVEIVRVESNDSMRRQLEKIITRLIQENVRPEDIAVLVETEDDIKRLTPGAKCAGLAVVTSSAMKMEALTVDTIRSFKGLESRVVIAVCSSRMSIEKELPYVAFSRARVHLILLGPEGILEELKAQA